jgi:hypothetical protein
MIRMKKTSAIQFLAFLGYLLGALSISGFCRPCCLLFEARSQETLRKKNCSRRFEFDFQPVLSCGSSRALAQPTYESANQPEDVANAGGRLKKEPSNANAPSTEPEPLNKDLKKKGPVTKMKKKPAIARKAPPPGFKKIANYFEEKYNIPRGLLSAIAWVESLYCPWAVNNTLSGKYFKKREDAVLYINKLRKSPQISISVGYMQINLKVHLSRFEGVDEALDPYNNIRVAAEILAALFEATKSWQSAVCWYNPRAGGPNQVYSDKVFAVYAAQKEIV